MKLTFVHDGPLFYDDTGNYYEFTYHELYERYSYMADDISFLMRTKKITQDRKYTLVPKQINVIPVPDFKSPKEIKNRADAVEIIKNTICSSDILVFRLQSSIAQIGIKYAKKYKKPYIIESVACPWDSYWNHSLIGKFVAPFAYFETRKAIKDAKYVYYVTTSFLQRRYPTNGKTCSCSNVVLNCLDESILNQRIKKISDMDGKSIILGTAAALDVKYKGQEYVIKAIHNLNKKGYNIKYKLAGGLTGKSENTYLKDLVKQMGMEKNVQFLGSLTADQMNAYYDDLDIYIQPSKQEGLPRSVIEAMSRGCPCLGTNIAGIPELLEKECLFKKSSVQEVENAIVAILNNDLKVIAKTNFEKAKRYEKDKLIKKREVFYKDFMENYFRI